MFWFFFEEEIKMMLREILLGGCVLFFFLAKLTGLADGVKLKIRGGWEEDGGVGVGGGVRVG